MKKVVLSACILLTSVFGVSGANAQSSVEYNNISSAYLQSQKSAINYVNVISQNAGVWENSTLKYEFPLYDFNENVTAFLFSIKSNNISGGYVIVSSNTNVVLESTRDGQHPYTSLGEGGQAIYVGPAQYYIKLSNGAYYDVREQKTIERYNMKSQGTLLGIDLSQEILPNSSIVESNVNTNNIQPSTIVSYSFKKISNVADLTWMLGCSPASFGNIVKYWKSKGYTSLIGSTVSDNSLQSILAAYMKTDPNNGTSDWNDRVTGMTNYWKDRGYNVAVSRVSPNFSTHKTEMNANRPNIINTVNDPTYTNHDMTGVGFEEYQDTDYNLKWFRYVIVHDTWGNTPTDVYLYLDQLAFNEIVKVIPQ